MEDIKKNESKINDMRKNIILIQAIIKKIKENYEDIVKELITKTIKKEIFEEEIKNFINDRKEVEKIFLKINIMGDNLSTLSRKLSENDKNKIEKYYNIEDFSQNELVDIFETTQSTVLRTTKEKSVIDERLSYEGNGILTIAQNSYPIDLKLKLLEEGRYILTGTLDKKKTNILPVYFSNEEVNDIVLKNIVLKNVNNQVVKQKELKKLFISKISENGLMYRFIPRNGFIEMEKEENYPNHYYIYAGISEQIGLGLEINGIVIQNDPYQRNLVCIYSKKREIQKNLLENIVLSLELLHGHSIRKISEEDIGRKIRFFIEGKYGKKNYDENNISESILRDFLYASNFIYRVLEFFDKKNEIERKKWKRAIKLIISYKESSNIDLLIRLFQFFDIFKQDNKSYKNNLIDEFNLEESEAKFIKEVRNDIVHEGLFLDESLLKNIDILDENSNLKKLLFRTENLFKQVVLLAFYIEEIVIKYFILNLPFSKKGMEVFNGLFEIFGLKISNSLNGEFKNYEKLYKEILNS